MESVMKKITNVIVDDSHSGGGVNDLHSLLSLHHQEIHLKLLWDLICDVIVDNFNPGARLAVKWSESDARGLWRKVRASYGRGTIFKTALIVLVLPTFCFF